MVDAVVLIKVEPGSVTKIANALLDLKGITEVFSVAGNYDVVALVHVLENEDLAELVGERIRNVQGIHSTQTLIAFRKYSRRERETGFNLGID